MLKAVGFGAVVALAACAFWCSTAADAQAADDGPPSPAPLLTGTVRDQSGAVPPALVVLRDERGRVVGSASTGRDGTFATLLSGVPSEVQVSCAHCAPLRAKVTGGPLVLVVTRFAALAGGPPDSADLGVLPYRDPAQAIALTPFVVAAQSAGGLVSALSDRGLDNGNGLVRDGGVAAYDPGSGDPGLFAFPGRSLGSVALIPASRAFTYGSYAGGGSFALDPFGPEDRSGVTTAFDSGWGFALGTAVHQGPVDVALAGSEDPDGVLRERVDAALGGDVAGGTLRARIGVASQASDDLAVADARSRALADLEYARISQRAVTSVEFDALESHAAYLGYATYGSEPVVTTVDAGALDASLRVERPAWLTLAYGALLRRADAGYGDALYAQPSAAYASESAYFEAGHDEAAHDGPFSFDAGLGVQHSSARLSSSGTSAGENVLLPSLVAGDALGPDLILRAGLSTALRAPLPYELPADLKGAYTVERSALREVALEFDEQRRLRFGATLFGEHATGLETQSLNGLGFSVAWQIAPRLSLRAWTLHDALDPGTQLASGPFAGFGQSLARAVAWLSYEAPGGLRVDLLARGARDATGRESDLDADVVVPVRATLALTAGSERERGRRRSYLGLRVR